MIKGIFRIWKFAYRCSEYILNYIYRTTEIFTWLLEVADDTKDLIEGGKIVWSVTYIYDAPKDALVDFTPEDNKKRVITKLEVNKDDIQAVLPMAKVSDYCCFYFIWSNLFH